MTEDKYMAKITALMLAAMFSVACLAAPPADPGPDKTKTPAPGDLVLPGNGGSSDGKHCEWACLRWEKQCNVDPRGVYKCMRVCGQFGQQCE